jgi:poly(hydroxyalkanoate) depolymerase family esterase
MNQTPTPREPGLWSKARAWAARLFRRRPAPARWLDGHASAWRGFLAFRPWVWPRRAYRLYLPAGFANHDAALLVLVHGCRQTADDLARGTRITALADELGAVVLMPHQKDAANPERCWNWFDGPTAAGRGEAAIVAAMIRKVRRRYDIDPARVCVAGLSAGAALATTIGVRHPSLVASVFSHSGLACAAASSVFTAITVMRRGPDNDVTAAAMDTRSEGVDVRVPVLVVQGKDDAVVAPRNAGAIARQYLALNGVEVPAGAETTLPAPDVDRTDAATLPYTMRTREWRRDQRVVVRLVEVDNLGHAWAGGDPAVPFNDSAAPDATAMLGRWLADAAR